MIIIDLWGLREYNRYNFFLLFFWTYILYWHLKQWHLGDVNTCHKKSVSSDGAGAQFDRNTRFSYSFCILPLSSDPSNTKRYNRRLLDTLCSEAMNSEFTRITEPPPVQCLCILDNCSGWLSSYRKTEKKRKYSIDTMARYTWGSLQKKKDPKR